MATHDFARSTARQLLQALSTRDCSALDLCDAAIARIERDDPRINAVVVRDFERAREQARAADAALARGERRPLLGLPMTVKEAFNVAGLRTTWGFVPRRDFVASTDAVMVQRLKAAGAVIVGKTNVATMLADWQSLNPIYGHTLNPLDTTRTAGGSSGGSAAALAAGFTPLELGSDIGGSIRVPAHFCGVMGHKPSHGLLPSRGHDFPGAQNEPDVLSVVGPMARDVDDLSLALDVLAGPDLADATGYRLALPPARHDSPRGCRVLVLTEHPVARTAADVREAVLQAAQRLAEAGAEVETGSDLLPDLAAIHRDYMSLLIAITSRGAPNASGLTAHQYMDLLDRRGQVRRQWRALFERFDIVLMPPFGTAAYPHVLEPELEKRQLLVDGEPTPYGDQLGWPALATHGGLPVTVVPVGLSREGLPIGVQVVGGFLEDRTTLAAARWLAA